MSKVSVGLRGWRFEESEIFADDGTFKPLEEIPLDPRQRLIRLTTLMEKPCDACYLEHGNENIRRCREAAIVYGEPMGEVILCAQHEPDFMYWYQHEDGSQFRGEEEFADAFHEWYAAGNRSPAEYGTVEHVDTDPDNLPSPPSPEEVYAELLEEYEPRRIDLRQYDDEPNGEEREPLTNEDLDEIDFGTQYPRKK